MGNWQEEMLPFWNNGIQKSVANYRARSTTVQQTRIFRVVD
jgi:hypothetical protein